MVTAAAVLDAMAGGSEELLTSFERPQPQRLGEEEFRLPIMPNSERLHSVISLG
ncbi:hypothetical protein [Plantactinospora sp. BC1]|uniref:hypothetical protein n=1 Tax=Plantactinospora sp. BC1 TaxID=2108470 RepID=UPI00131EE293|nr:hypothetical protein [Plantactinospora sp. BC1]